MAKPKDSTSSWLHRRRRAVRCKRHGLHYDPALTSGCALCRKEGLLDLPVRKPRFILLLLALLGIALISLRLSGPLAETVATLGDEPPTAAAAGEGEATATSTIRRLPPSEFASELEAIEAALYRPTSGEPAAVAADIQSSVAALASRLDTAGTTAARDAAAAVAGYAGQVDDPVFAAEDLPSLRHRWRRLRSTYFLGGGPPSGGEGASYDVAALVRYREAARRLVTLVEDGRTLASPLGKVQRPWDAQEDRAERQRAWQPLRTDWQQQLEAFATELPSRPSASAPPRLLSAVALLEAALQEARALAADPDLPLDAAADDRFDAALTAANEAVLALDDPTLLTS